MLAFLNSCRHAPRATRRSLGAAALAAAISFVVPVAAGQTVCCQGEPGDLTAGTSSTRCDPLAAIERGWDPVELNTAHLFLELPALRLLLVAAQYLSVETGGGACEAAAFDAAPHVTDGEHVAIMSASTSD